MDVLTMCLCADIHRDSGMVGPGQLRFAACPEVPSLAFLDKAVAASIEDNCLEIGEVGKVGVSTFYSGKVSRAIKDLVPAGRASCYVLGIEGLLDEGLKPRADFELVAACPIKELRGNLQIIRASRTLEASDYWLLVVEMSVDGSIDLLDSQTRGYLVGVEYDTEKVRCVVVRCAGYLDGDVDMLVRTRGDASSIPSALSNF